MAKMGSARRRLEAHRSPVIAIRSHETVSGCTGSGIILKLNIKPAARLRISRRSMRWGSINGHTCEQRRMDYAISTPDTIANAMVAALNQPAEFKPVESDGGHARRAHARRSPLIQ
jgi:hypothetical protein